MQNQPASPAEGSGENGGKSRATAPPGTEAGFLQMACLGRSFYLGSLYDCRIESIIPGLGLWTQSSLEQLVQSSQKPCSEAKLIAEDNMQAKANTLNVTAELKLSLLGDLITVSGAGKYLNDKTTSNHQSRLTIKYHCTSREERLIMEHLTKLDFKEEILEMNPEATHVVTAILYGANAFMVFDRHHDNTEEKRKVKGKLEAVVKKFVDNEMGGNFDLEMTKEEKDLAENLSCTFYGDFKPRINPTSYNEAMCVWRELPGFLDEKKHVPIRVCLYSINKLFNRTGYIQQRISVSLIDRVVEQMDRADNCVVLANDLLKTITFRNFKGLAHKANNFLETLSIFTSLVKQELQLLLPSIRSGSQNEQKLFDLLHAWDASPFALSRLDSWLNEYTALDVMINQYLTKLRKKNSNIREAIEEGSMEAAMLDMHMDSECECVIVYFFHLNSEDKHLSAMAEKVTKRDLEDNLSLSTYPDASLRVQKVASNNMLVPTQRFFKLAECNSENDKMKFLFAEHPERCSQTHCSISVYIDGEEVEKDYSPPSAPGKPQIKYEAHKLIVYWEPPKHGQENVDHYNVLVSGDFEGNRATKCIQIFSEVCSLHLPRESKNTVYHVKIETWCKYGKTACSDEVTFEDPGTDGDGERGQPQHSEQLGNHQIQKDKLLRESECVREGYPSVHLLNMKEEYADHSCRLRRLSYGLEDYTAPKPMKTILVMGSTGAGKSTLINGLCNHLLGVKFKDNYRVCIIEPRPASESAVSQTKWVTAYVIYHRDTFPIHFQFNLTIIDTPGFGDTGGLQEDEKIKEQLSQLFHETGVKGINSLDAIGFVVQSSHAKLTIPQKYISHSVCALFGKDIAENIFILATFADSHKPPVIAALDADQLPYTDYFKFNNSALFAEQPYVEEDEPSFDKMYWKMGASSYDDFLVRVSQAETKSLSLTKEVLVEREYLQLHVSGLQNQIKMAFTTSENLQTALDCIMKNQTDIDRNKDFSYVFKQAKLVTIPLDAGVFATNCLTCNRTCHYPCTIPGNVKWRCDAMIPSHWFVNILATAYPLEIPSALVDKLQNTICVVCPGHCHWSKHKNSPERIEVREETITKTVSEMKAEYEKACEQRLDTGEVILKIIDDIETADNELVSLVDDVRKSLQRLSEIALRPDPMTTAEYIDLLIKSEEQQAQPGWAKRVRQLDSLRERAELIKEYAEYHGISEPFQTLKEELLDMKAQRVEGQSKEGGMMVSFKKWRENCAKVTQQLSLRLPKGFKRSQNKGQNH